MDRTMLLFIRFIHNVHTHTSFLTRFLGLAWAFILVASGYGLVLRRFSWLAKIDVLVIVQVILLKSGVPSSSRGERSRALTPGPERDTSLSLTPISCNGKFMSSALNCALCFPPFHQTVQVVIRYGC